MPRGRPPKIRKEETDVTADLEQNKPESTMAELNWAALKTKNNDEFSTKEDEPVVSPEIIVKKPKVQLPKKGKDAAGAFKSLVKAYSDKEKALFVNKDKPLISIPTGSWMLDYVTGTGGWVQGRISELYGPESCGKTTVAVSSALQAALLGIPTLFLDAEQAFMPSYAQKLGWDFDTGLFAVAQPESLEEAVDISFDFLDKLGQLFIIIDSIPALTPNKVLYKREVWDKTMGSKAKLQGEYLDSLQKKINRQDATVLALNQVRANMDAGFFGEKTQASGGWALKHYLSARFAMKVFKRESTKESDDFSGDTAQVINSILVQIKNKKNKIQNPYRSGIMYLKPGDGIDNTRNLIEAAISLKVVDKASGGRYSIPSYSDEKVHGMGALYELFENDPDLMLHTMKQLGWVKSDADSIDSSNLDLSSITTVEVTGDDYEDD